MKKLDHAHEKLHHFFLLQTVAASNNSESELEPSIPDDLNNSTYNLYKTIFESSSGELRKQLCR